MSETVFGKTVQLGEDEQAKLNRILTSDKPGSKFRAFKFLLSVEDCSVIVDEKPKVIELPTLPIAILPETKKSKKTSKPEASARRSNRCRGMVFAGAR
jgi:hypothetical protein